MILKTARVVKKRRSMLVTEQVVDIEVVRVSPVQVIFCRKVEKLVIVFLKTY